jgi:hypothetical protein
VNTGARYEIAIDGTPRTYRDLRELAIYAATHLKIKNPHADVTVLRPRNRQDDQRQTSAAEVARRAVGA